MLDRPLPNIFQVDTQSVCLIQRVPELITKLAPTGPFPTDVSAQFAYWRQLVTKRQPGDLPKHYLQQEDQLLDLIL